MLASAVTSGPSYSSTAPDPPNILIIIADDMGVDMVGVYDEGDSAAGFVPPTPNIDALSEDGVLFRNVWSNPVCSPTRATIMTGRYGFRTGIGWALKSISDPLSIDEFTMAESVSAAGYATALIGKWHLGDDAGSDEAPNEMGWQHFAGAMEGTLDDYCPRDCTGWRKVEDGDPTLSYNYATTEQVDDALDWLDEQAPMDPWLLWLAFNAPHDPFHLPPTDLHSYDELAESGESDHEYYKAMVQAMDSEIGRLLDSMDTEQLANTTIIFLGDNGTPKTTTMPPFISEHAKATMYEGGVNVPLIIAGAGVVDPGRESAALVNTTDLFATVAELTGGDYPDDRELDSISMVPYIQNTSRTSIRTWVYAEAFRDGDSGAAATGQTIRDRRYKLIRLDDDDEELLFDLVMDPWEGDDILTHDYMTEAETSAYSQLSAQLEILDAEAAAEDVE